MSELTSELDTSKRLIRLGHSPDADDAFMFYAIAKGKIHTGDFEFQHVIEDIERLNQRAMQTDSFQESIPLEVTAISFHTYAHVTHRYALLSAGASFGFHYGPIIVSKKPHMNKDLRGKKIAVPGTMTTAFLLLKLYEAAAGFRPAPTYEIVPFDKILMHVYEGKCDAGLLIHEGQLTYGRYKLYKIVDLGEWWDEKTSLPLPLGGDVVRKDLPLDTQRRLAGILKTSIEYAMVNRGEALEYSLPFARGLDARLVDEFIAMYVNEYTLHYDDKAKKAVAKLLEWGHKARLLKKMVKPEFVEPM